MPVELAPTNAGTKVFHSPSEYEGSLTRQHGFNRQVLKVDVPDEAYGQLAHVITTTTFEASRLLGIPPHQVSVEDTSDDNSQSEHYAVTRYTHRQGVLTSPPVIQFDPEFIRQVLQGLVEPKDELDAKSREWVRFQTAHELHHVYKVLTDFERFQSTYALFGRYFSTPTEQFLGNPYELGADEFAVEYAYRRRSTTAQDQRDQQLGIEIGVATLDRFKKLRNGLVTNKLSEVFATYETGV